MLRKPRKARAPKIPRKAAVRRKARPELSAADVAQFAPVAENHRQSEHAWLQLRVPPGEEDRWGAVEDHLLAKGERGDSERRWKYFGK